MSPIITRLQDYSKEYWRYWALRDPKDADVLIAKNLLATTDPIEVKSLFDSIFNLAEQI